MGRNATKSEGFADLTTRDSRSDKRGAKLPVPTILAPVFISICLVAGCDDSAPALPNGAVYPPGSEVRVHSSPAHALTTDETPVRTDLYLYGAEYYLVSGPPISFVFPKSAYASFRNLEGGPQADVSLRIDRETMLPVGSLLKDRSKWTSQDIWHEYNERYIRQDLKIDIRSNALTGTMTEEEHAEKVHFSEATPAELCGFALYPETPDSVEEGALPVMITGRVFPPASYQGIAIDQASKSRLAICVRGAPSC